MLLLYYNPTYDKYYLRYYKYVHYDYYLGYENQYGHMVVSILVIQDKGLVSVNDLREYMLQKNRRKIGLKERLINRGIDLLNKLK